MPLCHLQIKDLDAMGEGLKSAFDIFDICHGSGQMKLFMHKFGQQLKAAGVELRPAG